MHHSQWWNLVEIRTHPNIYACTRYLQDRRLNLNESTGAHKISPIIRGFIQVHKGTGQGHGHIWSNLSEKFLLLPSLSAIVKRSIHKSWCFRCYTIFRYSNANCIKISVEIWPIPKSSKLLCFQLLPARIKRRSKQNGGTRGSTRFLPL